ncbi:MAG: DedA family protein [Pseudomonadota bacterium]
MEIFSSLLDLLLHLDQHLLAMTQDYGTWVYLILFLIVFAETGLVIMPFLPGDSLLFVAGTLAASGALNIETMAILLAAASFSGDNINYWIGRYLGPKVFTRKDSRLLNRVYLEKTHAFYEHHGGKTILFARFLPIIRTFAPFVAGVGSMTYRRFLLYSACGSAAWIATFVGGGYYFGNLPIVKQNLTAFVLLIIVATVLPGFITFIRHKLRSPS